MTVWFFNFQSVNRVISEVYQTPFLLTSLHASIYILAFSVCFCFVNIRPLSYVTRERIAKSSISGVPICLLCTKRHSRMPVRALFPYIIKICIRITFTAHESSIALMGSRTLNVQLNKRKMRGVWRMP